MKGGAKGGLALAVAAGVVGLVAYLVTQDGGRPGVSTVVRQVTQRSAPEHVEVEDADASAVESGRSAAPEVVVSDPTPAIPSERLQPERSPGFTLALRIDPVVDVEVAVRIGVWDHDPADWLRGKTHLRDRRGSLLADDVMDELLAAHLMGPKLIELRDLPYGEPFWITLTPDNFQSGGLEGFPSLSVAHPPVASGAEPPDLLELALSPLGGVRGPVANPELNHTASVRHAVTRSSATASPSGFVELWPLPAGEVRLDVFLADAAGIVQTELSTLVENGRITLLEAPSLEAVAVHWSGIVVDDLEQPVRGTLDVFSPSDELLASLGVEQETGAFAWRGQSYPRLRLAFRPADEALHAPAELQLELPAEGPLKLIAPRRVPAWVQLYMEPPVAERGREPRIATVACIWTLRGEQVERTGYWFSGLVVGVSLESSSALDRPVSHESWPYLGAVPIGRYTVYASSGDLGAARQVIDVLPDESGEYVIGALVLGKGGVTVTGELVILAGGVPQARGAVELLVADPGASSEHVTDRTSWRFAAELAWRVGRAVRFGPGPFERSGLPAGPLQLSFMDVARNKLMGTVSIDAQSGETVDLGRIELELP